MDNVIKAYFYSGNIARTNTVFQYNRGMILKFMDVDLPATYRVDFANSLTGQSVTCVGTADGVIVPLEVMAKGCTVYAWAVIANEDSTVTEYQAMIPISPRAEPTDEAPNPEQQQVIDQLIAAMNLAVEQTGADVESADAAAAAAAASAQAAAASEAAAAASEQAAAASEQAAAGSASSASDDAATAASAASTATQQAGIATSGAGTATQKAADAAASAQAAAASETAAAGSASSASTDAATALSAASTATQQAGIATSGAETATQKAADAAASAQAAASSKTAAAGSAAAAATSETNAGAAETAAQTAQAAAEAAAQSVSESAAQIEENKEDIADLKSAIDQTNQNLSKIYDNGQLLTITQSAMLHPTGDGTITIDSNRNISYQENTNQSNAIGFSFASVIGKQYTASCNISMQSGNVSFNAVKGTTYSSTTFLAKEIIESSGTYSINFTATTETTTIWFYFTSDVNSASVSELLCTSGWGYKGLDTAFTSENRPAQGKAVGNVRDRVGALEIKMNSIIDDENLITVDTETVLHTAGDSIIAITDNNGFTSTNSGNTNNLIGLAFTTQAQTQYTIKFKVSTGTVNNCFLCKTETYNSSNYIMTWETLVDAAIEYTFTAITGTTSIWFNQKYNMPVITVEDFYCSDGILRYKHDMMDYQGNEIITFNKILCIGDSITEGTFNYTSGGSLNNVFADAKYSYPTYLKAMTGREVYNHGHGGYTAKQWYDTYGNTDLSGYDACIIMLGINDGVQEVGVEQFSTNMSNIINKVMADNDGIKVFVATIVPAYSDYNRRFDDYIAETRRLVEEDFTGAFLVDINKYSVCKYYTYYEHGHLTAIGYQQLAKEFFTLISYIMHNDLEAFKGIQFIGTNYEW